MNNLRLDSNKSLSHIYQLQIEDLQEVDPLRFQRPDQDLQSKDFKTLNFFGQESAVPESNFRLFPIFIL